MSSSRCSKNCFAVGLLEFDVAAFESFQHLVFLLIAQIGEVLVVVFVLAVADRARARTSRYCCAGAFLDCGPCCLDPFMKGGLL